MPENLLLELTREMLDLKKEKKDYNAEMNKKIKDLEDQIKVEAAK